MEKQFKLDEKMMGEDRCPSSNDAWFFKEDIKEFIKKVQEVVLLKGRRAKVDIDKLAGPKLITKQKMKITKEDLNKLQKLFMFVKLEKIASVEDRKWIIEFRERLKKRDVERELRGHIIK